MISRALKVFDSERPEDSAFAVLYTATLMILLTFLVGSFVAGSKQKAGATTGNSSVESSNKSVNVQAVSIEKKAFEQRASTTSFGVLTFNDIFNSKSAELNGEKLTGVVQVLKSHDVRAEFQIAVETGDSALLSIARAVALSRYFEEAGIPVDAFSVIAHAQVRPQQLSVQFETEGSRESIS